MTTFTKQPCFINVQCFNKHICDDAVCREEEHESTGYLVGTEVLVKSELRVPQVGFGKWEDGM